MDEEEAFLRAIAASPEEDLPRLAYCDWLEERGENLRAEFIRLSLAIRDETRKAQVASTWDRILRLSKYLHDHDELLPQPVSRLLRRVYVWEESQVLMGDNIELSFYQFATGYITGGFVGRIRCMLTVWLGVPCGLCESKGRTKVFLGRKNRKKAGVPKSRSCICLDCNGTGWRRTGSVGIGPELVTRLPITRVRIEELEPGLYEDAYVWVADDFPGHQFGGPASRVPRIVFDEMVSLSDRTERKVWPDGARLMTLSIPTKVRAGEHQSLALVRAFDLLSRACVSIARKHAEIIQLNRKDWP